MNTGQHQGIVQYIDERQGDFISSSSSLEVSTRVIKGRTGCDSSFSRWHRHRQAHR